MKVSIQINLFFLIKISIFLISLRVHSINIIHQNDLVLNDSVITWKDNFKLKWQDFKGEVNSNDSNVIAMTCTETIVENDGNSEKVSVVFLKYKSFKTAKVFQPKYIKNALIHEQLHFDIAELFARKLRKKIKDLGSEFTEDELSIALKKIKVESDYFQKTYDSATDFGNNLQKQKIWIFKVKTELRKYSKYAEN